MDIDFLPSRFACINTEWSLELVHMRLMSVFCHALENKNAPGAPSNSYYGGGQQQQHKSNKRPSRLK